MAPQKRKNANNQKQEISKEEKETTKKTASKKSNLDTK